MRFVKGGGGVATFFGIEFEDGEVLVWEDGCYHVFPNFHTTPPQVPTGKEIPPNEFFTLMGQHCLLILSEQASWK